MRTIGERIRCYRIKAGMTQEALAHRLGIKGPSVTQWEKDATTPNSKNILALADIFGVTPAAILHGQKASDSPKYAELLLKVEALRQKLTDEEMDQVIRYLEFQAHGK